MKVYGWVEVEPHHSRPWYEMEVNDQLQPGRFMALERSSGPPWIGGWMGPAVGLDAMKALPELEHRPSSL
jgi:hypothetical protein